MQRFITGLIFILGIGIGLGSDTTAAPRTIAIIVDDSGSMYGYPSGMARDVTPDLKQSLQIIVELLDTYNQHQEPDNKVTVVITCFGGKGVDVKGNPIEEFREIPLTGDPTQDIRRIFEEFSLVNPNRKSIKNQKLYQQTCFGMAFRKTQEKLDGQGGAMATIFLTDAVQTQSDDESLSLDISPFGNTYLFSLGEDIEELRQWSDRFRSNGQLSGFQMLRNGWEITPVFVSVFQKLLVPDDQSQYLVTEQTTADQSHPTITIQKLSDHAARYHIIFHSSSCPALRQITHQETPLVENQDYSVSHWTNFMTLEFPADKTPADAYQVVFDLPQSSMIASLVGLEDIPLVLMESRHPLDPMKSYPRNAEISLHFALMTTDDLTHPILSGDALNRFLQLINYSYQITEEIGSDTYQAPINPPFETLLSFHPTVQTNSRYVIRTGWSYHSAKPVVHTMAGGFILNQEPAISFHLTYTSDSLASGELWQGRVIGLEGWFSENPVPEKIQKITEIILQDSDSGAKYHVIRDPGQERFTGSLGRVIDTSVHTLEFAGAVPPGDYDLILEQRSFQTKPRKLTVDLKKTSFRQDLEKQGIWNQFVMGFRYLFGMESGKESIMEKRIDQASWTEDISILYYGHDAVSIELTPRIEPIFSDEECRKMYRTEGGLDFPAENAQLPYLWGFRHGEPQRIDHALTIALTPPGGILESSLIVKMQKIACDWEITKPLSPRPIVRLTSTIQWRNAPDLQLELPSEIVFNITSWGSNALDILRNAMFIAVLILIVVIGFFVLVTVVCFLRYIQVRRRLWREILTLAPQDFCLPIECKNAAFPEKAYRILEQKAAEREGTATPGRVMRDAIVNPNLRLLNKIYKRFRKRELLLLRNRCQEPNFDSEWTFSIADSPTIIVFGTEIPNDINAVRLRAPLGTFKARIGSITIHHKGDHWDIRLVPDSDIVVRYDNVDYILPVRDGILLTSGQRVWIGEQVGVWLVSFTVICVNDTVTLRFQPG